MECLLVITEHGKLKKVPFIVTESTKPLEGLESVLIERCIVLGLVTDTKGFLPLNSALLSPLENFIKSTGFANLRYITQLANKDDYREERELFTFSIV